MLPSTATSHKLFLGTGRVANRVRGSQDVCSKRSVRQGSTSLCRPFYSLSSASRGGDVLRVPLPTPPVILFSRQAASEDTQVVDSVVDEERKNFVVAISKGHLRKAEILFAEMQDKDLSVYNRMIKASVKNKQSHKSWEYYRLLLSNGLEPNLITYSIMMHVCAVEKNLKKAFELWSEVESKELPVDKIICNSVIQTCMITGNSDKAHEFLEMMLAKGIEPDSVTFNTMIGGYSRADMYPRLALEAVDSLLLKMKELNIDFDESTYMSLMRLSLNTGDPDKAIRYVDEMMDCGFDLNPAVYCSLIDEYARSYKGRNSRKVLEQCWRIYLDMDSRGVLATTDVFLALLKLFVRWGQWRYAFGLLDLMVEQNYHPTADVYAILFDGLAYSKRIGREVVVMTKILLEELLLAKIQLPHQAYRSVLSIFLDARDIDAARNHFQRMKKNVQMDTRDYNRLLQFYNDVRYTTNWETSYEEAMKLVEELKEASLRLDLSSYSIVLKICAKCKKWDEIDAFCTEMKERNLHPHISVYNVILDTCAKEATPEAIERAWKFFNEMKDYRIPLNVITYTTMINVCVAGNDVDAGYRLLDEMKEAGVNPNERTYASLVHLAGEAGRIDLAHEAFEEMSEQNVARNAAAYNVLIHACGKAKEAEKLMHAYSALKEEKISLDVSIFCNLIRSLGLCERIDLIYKVFDEFKQKGVYLSHKAYDLLSSTLKELGDEEGAAAIQQLENASNPAF